MTKRGTFPSKKRCHLDDSRNTETRYSNAHFNSALELFVSYWLIELEFNWWFSVRSQTCAQPRRQGNHVPSSNPDSPHQSCDRCSFDSDGEYWRRLREVSNFDERQTSERNSRAKYTRETQRTREARGVLKLLSASLVLAYFACSLIFLVIPIQNFSCCNFHFAA